MSLSVSVKLLINSGNDKFSILSLSSQAFQDSKLVSRSSLKSLLLSLSLRCDVSTWLLPLLLSGLY